MNTAVAATDASTNVIRELVAVTKPRITSTVVLTAASGVWLANRTFPEQALSWPMSLLAVLAVGVLVSGASALNCWYERHTDALMRRTRNRPIPSGRLAPGLALAWGLGLCALAIPVLSLVFHPLAGLLGFVALVSYVWIYTPMKRLSPDSLLVGAFPGAAPTIIAWTAVTGRMDLAGLALFAVLFVWQLPHFLAIAYLCKDDYERAGFQVHPVVHGERSTRRWAFFWTLVQIPVSLLLVVMGIAGWIYAGAALVCGLLYARAGWRWLGAGGTEGARRLMLASVLYLGLVFSALLLDAAL
ncbi:MAG: heme o synthase [Pseudomonadota bacterium]|nr:MAG: protoheme IX farnesyltransferase [Pseudomonadota bacterium]